MKWLKGRRRKIRMIKGVVSGMLAAILAAVPAAAAEQPQEAIHKIGVAVYDLEDQEVRMFRNYYENYIATGFLVEFLYSSNLGSLEEEEAFIEEAAEEGAEGIISFTSNDLEQIVEKCAEEEMYYLRGSGTVAGEAFDSVKDDPYFIGIIGPDEAQENEAGKDMASYFAEADTEKNRHYVIMTGGASDNNIMHLNRAEGMLEGLAAAYGYSYESDIRERLLQGEVAELEAGGIPVTLCPGYISNGEAQENLQKVLEGSDCDVLLSVLAVNELMDTVEAKEREQGRNIGIGTVDCFSESNQLLVEQKDDFGNPKLEYVCGKYASLVGPAFAAMYNVLDGYQEMMRQEGGAFSLNQGFWTARGPEEFAELYNYTQGIFANAYSIYDLQQVMPRYRFEADFEDFETLTGQWKVEDVRERLG